MSLMSSKDRGLGFVIPIILEEPVNPSENVMLRTSVKADNKVNPEE